ncbi:hypothetical protein AAL_03590 [Moelleriella libera RCEF 2490]|uniref:Iron-sulfur cluster assembly factor IBA57 homolog, mitochondrial n=1 Tax=Moelleriella libera RCEF 2490 TaxID=1081109 RepID=A0A168DDL8_9HYPO|nr:hypothetical protein AAL_03590 [Moelleriella libera RCEF 2490]
MQYLAWRAVLSRSAPRRGLAGIAFPKPPPSGVAALASRGLLSLTGPQATEFLHNITSARVKASDGIPPPAGIYAGIFSPQGRLQYDVFLYPLRGSKLQQEEDGYLIETDHDRLSSLEALVKKYGKFSKIKARVLSPDEASVWHAWDDSSSLPNLGPTDQRIVLKDPRAPGLGCRVIQLNNQAPEVDLDASSEAAYIVRRYLHGVPEGPEELPFDEAMPIENNMDLMNGIDFHKGCYLGQELIIRTRHRGQVRKRLLPCVIYGKDKAIVSPQSLAYNGDDASLGSIDASMIPTGTSIGPYDKRRPAGKWIKGVGNIGLALCRLEIMTDVRISEATPSHRPESSAADFSLEWGEEGKESMRVKAFVPQWLRDGLQAR